MTVIYVIYNQSILLLGHTVDKTPANLLYNGLETDWVGRGNLQWHVPEWILWMHTDMAVYTSTYVIFDVFRVIGKGDDLFIMDYVSNYLEYHFRIRIRF